MATLNEFKLVKLKSRNMFQYIPNIIKAVESDTEKERLGFYHLILEEITGISDADRIQELIQDQKYIEYIGGVKENDLGIDAVYISEEEQPEKQIMLFNFKYRIQFNPDKTTSENDVSLSIKFFQYLENNSPLPNFNSDSNVYKNLEKVRKCLNSDDIYNITLYFVTNEANGFQPKVTDLVKQFEQNYGMRIKTVSLDDIIAFIFPDKKSCSAKLFLGKDDFFTYSNDTRTSDASYICNISLFDLIRITCDNETLRNQHHIENDEDLNGCKLNYALLYDNVRGYLGQTNYNKNIYNTIKNDGKDFFLFNNGITITCLNVTSEPKNSNQKYLLTLSGIQIVNGGQTLRSIYNYFQNEVDFNRLENLRNSFVLVRIFKIDSENDLRNKIAEYTNSQNAISPIDLKSVSQIQIDLENYLKNQNILYARKAGDIGDNNSDYEYRISMEKFTQVLYASQGYPEKVSNLKRKLFTDYYDDIYSSQNFNIDQAKDLIELYFQIDKFYQEKQNKEKYNQKIFYIIYIVKQYGKEIEEADTILQKALEAYKKTAEEAIKDSRVLLKSDFRISIEKFIKK